MIKEKYSLEIANKDCKAVQDFCDDLLYLYESRHFNSNSICQIIETVYEWISTKDYTLNEKGCQDIPIWNDEFDCSTY